MLSTFSNGEELLKFFEDSSLAPETRSQAHRSMIIMDYRVPGMSGFETATRLKQIDPDPKIVFVVDEWKSKDSNQSKVFDAILYKPFSIHELLELIDYFSSPIRNIEGSQIFEDPDQIRQLFRDLISERNERMYVCCDKSNVFRILTWQLTNSFLRDALSKGTKVFFVTELTPNNLQFCKRLGEELGIQFRHFAGLQSNFIVVDEARVISTLAFSKDHVAAELITFSNLKAVVKQTKYLFDFLWKNSADGPQSIRRLENSVEIKKTLNVYVESDEALSKRISLVNNAKSWVNACYEARFASLVNLPGLRESYMTAVGRGVHIRHITEVNASNIDSCRKLIQIGIELRHLPNVIGGFAMNEEELIARATYENPLAESESIHSNYPLLVKEHQSIFNMLWRSARPAETFIADSSIELKRKETVETDSL